MALELPDFWFSKSKKLGFANGKMGLEFGNSFVLVHSYLGVLTDRGYLVLFRDWH
jgi:hypothetical protein